MKLLSTTLPFILVALFGLYSFVNAQQTTDATIIHNGIARDYRLYIPAAYNGNTAVPLLFNLHGYGGDNLSQEWYGDFRPIADTANFIICLPNGTFDLSAKRFWNVGFTSSNIDDVGFISALIDVISVHYNIDASRIYSTGMSNGGFMSYSLACQLSGRIAAIASVTGGMTVAQQGNCTPPRTVPVMQIHGTADPIVPYAGNASILPIDTLIKNWVNRNGCNAAPVITPVPDNDPADGSTAERHDYNNCNTGGAVVLYKAENAVHTWPGASIAFGITNMDFSASLEIWKFFLQFRHPNPALSAADLMKNKGIEIYPNPAQYVISIQSSVSLSNELSGMDGKIMIQRNKQTVLDIAALPAGVYILSLFDEQGMRMKTEKIVKTK